MADEAPAQPPSPMELARKELESVMNIPADQKDRTQKLQEAVTKGIQAGLTDDELATVKAALKEAQVAEATKELQEAVSKKEACEVKVESLKTAIVHGREAGLGEAEPGEGEEKSPLFAALEALKKEEEKVKAQEVCDSAVKTKDFDELIAAVAAGEKAGLEDSAAFNAAKLALTEAKAQRTTAAKEGLKTALDTKLVYDLKAAVEEAAKCDLQDEPNFVACQKLVEEMERKILAREHLEKAMAAYEQGHGCLDCYCCSDPDVGKMKALEVAIEAAKAAELKESEYLDAQKLLAQKKLVWAVNINVDKLGAAAKTRELRAAIALAEALFVSEDLIQPARDAEKEANELWKTDARGEIARGVAEDDGFQESTGERLLASITCGYMKKPHPEYHRIKALEYAIKDGEAAGLDDDELEKGRLMLEECRGDLTSRMALLERKVVEFEARRFLYQHAPGCCSKMCTAIYTFIDAVPFASILSFGASVAGLVIVYMYMDQAQVAVDTLDVTVHDTSTIAEDGTYILALMLCVNALALVCAFPATGAFRQWFYGHKHKGITSVIECLVGPCTVGFVLALVAVCYLALLAGICLLLPLFTVLGLGSVVCDVEPGAVKDVAAALHGTSFFAVNVKILTAALGNLCDLKHRELVLGCGKFMAGLSIFAVAQAWTQVNTIMNLERIWMQVETPELNMTKAEEARAEILRLTADDDA